MAQSRAWFLRARKLRTKPASNRLIPKNDAANVAPFLPQSAPPPPFNGRDWIPTVIAAWTLTPILLWQNVQTPATPNDPPYGAKPWLENVVAQWEPAPPQPAQARRSATQPVANDPPFGSAIQVIPWAEDVFGVQARRFVPQGAAVATDAPPPGARAFLANVLRNWDPDPAWPAQPRDFQPQGAFYDPPWGAKGWVANVRQAWEPETPRQYARVLLRPPTSDSPPFGDKPWVDGVIAAWVQEAPFVGKPPIRLVQTPAAQVDNPPFGLRPWRPTVLDAWAPAPYTPQVLEHVAQSAASDNPPFGRRLWFSGVLESWQPTTPMQMVIRHRTDGSTAVTAIFGFGARSAIGTRSAADAAKQVGTDVAVKVDSGVGTDSAVDPNKGIGSSKA